MGVSTWTQEEKDQIAGMLLENMPASKIAPIIGCTRNAVIGVVRRDPALRAIGLHAVKWSWPQVDRDKIAGMMIKKMSAGKIAVHFGCTRHAIIGVVSRDPVLKKIGLQGGPPPRAKPREAKPIKCEIKGEKRKPIVILPVPSGRFITLMDLKHGECKWPVNDAARGELHRFCGTPAQPEKPYCAGHAALAIGKGTSSERDAARQLRRSALDQRQGTTP